MKTTSRWSHLRGLFLLSAGVALGGLVCAPAFAGSTIMTRESSSAQMQTAEQKPAQKKVVFYVLSSASAIPRPITWVVNGVLTTAVPVEIIGRGETMYR